MVGVAIVKRLLILSMLLLSACASIPDLSPVSVISQVDVNSANDPVRVIARPPTKKMTQVEIVEGFIAANASISNDYSVAREYLLSSANKDWQTSNTYLIDPAQTRIDSVDSSTVAVTLTEIGQLDGYSRLSWFGSAIQKTYNFNVAETKDGFRIGSMDFPVVLSSKDFQRNYTHFTLFFLNQDLNRLVPDDVWLTASAPTGATQLMNALLKGVPKDYQGAMRSAIPQGVKLELAAVTTSNGVSNVALTSEAWQLSRQQRKALLAEIVWTLTGLVSTDSVSVNVGSQPLTLDGTQQISRKQVASFSPENSSADDGLFYSDSKGLSRYAKGSAVNVSGVTGLQQIAVTSDGTRVAFIQGGDAFLAPITNVDAAVRISKKISGADFDSQDRLWLLEESGKIVVKSGAREPLAVGAVPAKVLAISVSPDGSRLATIQATSNGNVLRIHSIINSANGISLTVGRRIETAFTDVTDVDWISSTELVAIAREGSTESHVYRFSFDGAAPRSQGVVADAAQVSAGFNVPIAVLTRQGLLVQQLAGKWTPFRTVTSAAYAS
jgi:hypothetical protein